MLRNEKSMIIAEQFQSINSIKAQLKTALAAKSVTVPDGLAFNQYPEKIKEIIVASSANAQLSYTSSPSGLVADTLTLNPPCSYIQDNAFKGVYLRRINFPATLLYIGTAAFQNCYKLEYINILSSVIGVGMQVFKGCTALLEAECNQSADTLNADFFSGCILLKKVTLGQSIKIIASNAFYNLPALQELNVQYIETLMNYAFVNCSLLKSLNFTSLKSIPLGYALSTLPALESIDFGACASFPAGSLATAAKLKKIIFSDKAVSFAANAFTSLTGMKYLEFNALSAISFANSSFTGMSALEAIVFKSNTPPALTGTSPFAGIASTLKIYVPDDAVTAYKTAANWSILAAYVYPMSQFIMPAV